jgi:hypothetical protein
MRIGGAFITILLALLATLTAGKAYAGGPFPIPPLPGWLCWLIIIILIVIIIILWRGRRRS